MSNLKIIFTYSPYIMLLLIPALVLTLWPYFRLSKKYRRTRNRILSISLHLIIMVLCVSVLAGAKLSYEKPNLENEVMFVVDLSDSNKQLEDRKNAFIQEALYESYSSFHVGIISFGYGYVYEAKLSTDTERVYNQYINSARPNGSATDIATVLDFAKDQFQNPKGAKIVLITDGLETDNKASNVLTKIIAQGTRIDTVYFSNEQNDEILITSVDVPDYTISVGDTIDITVQVRSTFAIDADITLFDKHGADIVIEGETKRESFVRGVKPVKFQHTFLDSGSHTIYFKIQDVEDKELYYQNNSFYSHINIEVYDKVLIIEKFDNESDSLYNMIKDEYDVAEPINIDDTQDFTLNSLKQYDEIILVNVANSDMPEGFDALLYDYVKKEGGGLFTVGGTRPLYDDKGEVVLDDENNQVFVPNAYNRDDMQKASMYKELLPVSIIDYTPPLGLIIIIDRSVSMADTMTSAGKTRLQLAKEGAASAINSLSPRDYCGVISLDDGAQVELQLTPQPQKQKVLDAINNIQRGGGTVYSHAIARACEALSTSNYVDKKHIIFVSDGEPSGGDDYLSVMEMYNKTFGITMSVFTIGATEDGKKIGQDLADKGAGRAYLNIEPLLVPASMREDLKVDEIKEYEQKPFNPKIENHTSLVKDLIGVPIPKLDGFFGAVEKAEAQVILSGQYSYIPIYAQWKTGEGRVGSFLSDLNWSSTFITDENFGIPFIKAAIKGLFPTTSIRPSDVDVKLTVDNFGRQLDIRTTSTLKENEVIEVKITEPFDDVWTEPPVHTFTQPLNDFRINYSVSRPGTYKIVIQKLVDGEALTAPYVAFTTFSYSKEYDVFLEPNDGLGLISYISEETKGKVISEVQEIYDDADITFDNEFDPKIPFIIIAIILFLLDIAIRKFKFKWPWEIVRDYKAKKEILKNKS